MKIESIKIKKNVTWAVICLYVSINSCFNLLPLDLAPDIVFAIIIMYMCVDCIKNNIKISRHDNKEYIVISSFLVIIACYIVINLIQGKQSIFDIFFTAREMLYLSVFYYFGKKENYSEDIVKTILVLEVIGSIFYLLNVIIGEAISPLAPYTGYTVPLGLINLYRDHSLMPNLQFFSCAYLFIKFMKKEFVFSMKKDIGSLILIVLATFLKMFRTRITLLLCCFALIFFVTKSKKKSFNLRKIKYGLVITLIVSAVVLFMPSIRNRFIEAVTSVQNALNTGSFSAYEGTSVLRLWLLESRIDYLLENNQLLFGMGLISSRNTTEYFVADSTTGYMSGGFATVYNSDNALLTLLPRYGVIGTLLYLGGLIVIGIGLLKRKTDFSKAVGVFIICQVLEGVSGNGTVAETGPLLIGMLIGLAISERKGQKIEVKTDGSLCCNSNIQ